MDVAMARAFAEADERLIDMLRTKYAGLCTVAHVHSETGTGVNGPIFGVTIDSPLIDEMWGHIEIVIDNGALRFKPWRDC
jgi:hypothetical protein